MKSKLLNKQKLFLGGLIVVLVFSAFLYLPVTAHEDEDEDGIDDETEDENRREVDIEYAPYEVTISSSIENNGIDNEFQIQVTVGSDGLVIELEFEEDNDTLETEIEFEVRFTEIIEFRDLSSDGIYNASDDVIKTLELDDFKPIIYTTETIDNETVHVFFIETTDDIFTSTLYITGDFANISGVVIAPTQMKIDIGIHDFDYDELDTQLALKVELESELDVDYEDDEETEDEEYGYSDDEHEIEVNLADYSGFFSWIETVTVDDVEYEVKVTPLEYDGEDYRMYFNYPRGSDIIHDPKIGLSGILTGLDSPTIDPLIGSWVNLPLVSQNELLIVSAISFLILTGLVLVFRRNKVA